MPPPSTPKKAQAPKPLMSSYIPPRPCLEPCAGCGRIVLAHRWCHGTKEELGRYEDIVPCCPLTGERHVCEGGKDETSRLPA